MYKKILKQYWGYDDFRGIQLEIIKSICSGKDTLGLMPTGGGKSITFQVPALLKEGVCIVVTPLIALMKDQVQHLRQKNIMATAIYSGMSHDEILKSLENCILGDYKFLYVSPERLSSQLFISKLSHMRVSFITVDEAHCISQWGYDFRPSYLHIANIRKIKPGVPILALTATATSVVVDDIQERLEFRNKNVFRMSFERENLIYVVREASDKIAEVVHILNSIKGSSIIYTRSRKGCRDLAKILNDNNIDATYYHAGLEPAVKDLRQHQWQNDEIRVMVATNAFGMGIDKPDVRMVLHMECPDAVEAYFQEAGRAGRDGNRSWAVLLFNQNDESKLKKRIADTYPEKDFVKSVYEHLAYYYQIAMGYGRGQTHSFDIAKFCHAYRMFPTLVDSSLRILQNAGYLLYETDPDTKARVLFTLSRNELSRLNDLAPIEERIITAMMRMYGGLFTDYVYIDESAVSIATGLDQNIVYLTLKSLSQRHIIHFIPQRKMPFITFLQNRVETDEIILRRNVYEQRKEQMSKNIEAIVSYAKNDKECRSIQLLRYFGEVSTNECCKCDACRQRLGEPTNKAIKSASEAILMMLNDKGKHEISELSKIPLPRFQMDAALKSLIDDEKVVVENNLIFMK